MARSLLAALAAAAVLSSSGCASVGMSVLSAGLSLGIGHQLNGVTTRTFTETAARVEEATVAALTQMGLSVDARESHESHRLIKASTPERSILIEIEPVSAQATQVRATTRRNDALLLDGATSAEIVAQTAVALSKPAAPTGEGRATAVAIGAPAAIAIAETRKPARPSGPNGKSVARRSAVSHP